VQLAGEIVGGAQRHQKLNFGQDVTHDSGAVLHRCVGVEGCGECPQAVECAGSMGGAGGEACGAARALANFCAA
jgi:hypothetical protein